MSEEKTQCTEDARVQLPWAGEFVKMCPAHGNALVILSQHMGAPISAQIISKGAGIKCSSFDELTEQQKELNATFPY